MTEPISARRVALPVVLLAAATTRLIPADKRGIATGIVNAGGSFGQFVMAPVATALLVSVGWASALQILAAVLLLGLPAALVLRGNSQHATPAGQSPMST